MTKTDAQLTVEHSILSGITDVWHKKDDPNFPIILRDSVFNKLFDPILIWATKEYIDELNTD